jgi:hypothetical protein
MPQGSDEHRSHAVDLKEDTRQVREEFDAISKPTQVFIAVLVALGMIAGALLAGLIGYGYAPVDGREGCIERRDTVYCEEGVQG